ncbi:MAG: AAA family ATPase [Acidobacteria bacterium]|nr:AAA family ATPase [Acidobacteriota bacterium]
MDLGVPYNILVDLMLKVTMLEGSTSLGRMSQIMKVSAPISDAVFHHLRKEQFVEVKGMRGNDYEFTLSATGRKIAQDRYAISQYVGPVPVPLDDYVDAVRQQAVKYHITREYLQKVFYDLVLPDEMLDQLGPAIISNSQIFLYGSTGNGKTSIAERLVRIYDDSVYMPHAIEVQGQIINFHDSVVHQPLEQEEGADARWIRCERPCIAVGGEMVQEMLELRYEETLGYYTAPLQMKANNGLFIIDDFGCQMINPRDLLNRWIVPLDRGIDFLSLRTGVKFPIPFETMVVFSTNLDPRQLADEAFLRRIQNKVKVETISPEIFDRILQRICEAAEIEWTEEASLYIQERCSADARKPVLRACYPRDVVAILQNIAKYEGRRPTLNNEDVDRAITLYFAR